MSQSLLRTLHTRGETPIDLIASPWNADAAKLLPEVREVFVPTFRKGSLEWSKRKQLGLELSSKGYAAYILPTPSNQPWCLGGHGLHVASAGGVNGATSS